MYVYVHLLRCMMNSMKVYVCAYLLRCIRMIRSGIIKHVHLCVSTPIRVYVHMWFIQASIITPNTY